MSDESNEHAEWRRLWADAMTEANFSAADAVLVFAKQIQARTRELLEVNPPPPSVVANAVEKIAGLAHALKHELHPTEWIGHQIYVALAPIRGVLREAAARESIRTIADEPEPKVKPVKPVPVTTAIVTEYIPPTFGSGGVTSRQGSS